MLRLALLSCAAAVHAQTPQFLPTNLPGLQFPMANEVAWGDYDRDGDLDLFVVSPFGGKLLRNEGGGSFTDLTAGLPLLAPNQRTAVFVQADGDGWPDLLLTWTGQARLLRNLAGAGWLELPANLPAGLPTIHGVVAADIDGDGDEDLVCAGHILDGGVNQLLSNDGTGVFTRTLPFSGTAFQPLVADVDGDGDLDVFFVRGMFGLFRNDGGGGFTDRSVAALPAGFAGATAMALGDVDANGTVDVFLGGTNDAILLNDGSGTFALEVGAAPPGLGATQRTALVDVDGDGYPDLVRGTANFGSPTLALNDGSGTFQYANGRLPALAALAGQIQAADLDLDGDPDLLLTGLGVAPQVLWNGHRHLTVAVQPTFGGSLAYDVWSQPGYGSVGRVAMLAVGLFRLPNRVLVPNLGWLALDLGGPTALVAVGFPPASGPQRVAFPVPNLPGLVGLPLLAQAFVDLTPDPAATRLSALVATAIR
jgi:hypothetical protein